MSVLGNVFNIVIFVSLVGSVFSVLSLLAKKVLNIALPLWFWSVWNWVLPHTAHSAHTATCSAGINLVDLRLSGCVSDMDIGGNHFRHVLRDKEPIGMPGA